MALPGISVLRDGGELQCLRRFEYVDFRYRLGRQKNSGETFDEGAEETKGHSRQSAGYIPGARLLVAAS